MVLVDESAGLARVAEVEGGWGKRHLYDGEIKGTGLHKHRWRVLGKQRPPLYAHMTLHSLACLCTHGCNYCCVAHAISWSHRSGSIAW